MKAVRFLIMAVGLALLHGAVRADAPVSYQIEPIVKFGDRVGDLTIKGATGFEIGALNDNGQLVFAAENAASGGGQMLIQYSDGQFIPLSAAGGEAPGGRWAAPGVVYSPVSMNSQGDVVFGGDVTAGDRSEPGTYLWDYQSRQTTPVALKGMPASGNQVIEKAAWFAPTINNKGEIALVVDVKDAEGRPQSSIFLRRTDGAMEPVALPGDPLPDGQKVLSAIFPTINDEGVISFQAVRQSDGAENTYLWDKGSIAPLATVGMTSPDGGVIAKSWSARVNNHNRTVLVVAMVDDKEGPESLYRWENGKLTQLLLPDDPLPGGGTYQRLHPVGLGHYGVSAANSLGQHAILVTLSDGSTGAYLLDPDGRLALIMKSGTDTPLGKVVNVGQGGGASLGIGLNSKGQVALTAKLDDGPDTIVLLTPTTL